MRSIKLYALSAAATVLLSTGAYADEPALFSRGGYAGEAMHHAADAPRGVVTYPELHWTSRIGTGTATTSATPNSAREDGGAVGVEAGPVRYPELNWASRIGTGTVSGF
jgi:hypothetical protein